MSTEHVRVYECRHAAWRQRMTVLMWLL